MSSISDPREELLGALLTPVREAAAYAPTGTAEVVEAEAALRRAYPTFTNKQIEHILWSVDDDWAHDRRTYLTYADAVRMAGAEYARALPVKTADTQNAAALDTILDSGRL